MIAAICCGAGLLGWLAVVLAQVGRGAWAPLRVTRATLTAGLCSVLILVSSTAGYALPPGAALVASLSNGWVYVAGLASQGCGYFGGLLLMRQAPHSLCVPLNRAASVLAGLLASCALGRWPSRWEIFGALVMTIALAVGVWPVRAKRAARLDLRAKVALWRLAHAEPSAA